MLTLGRVVQLAFAAGIIVFVAALVVPAYKAMREHPRELVLATKPPGLGPMDETTPLGPEPGEEVKTRDALDEMTADGVVKTPLGRIVPKTAETKAGRFAAPLLPRIAKPRTANDPESAAEPSQFYAVVPAGGGGSAAGGASAKNKGPRRRSRPGVACVFL